MDSPDSLSRRAVSALSVQYDPPDPKTNQWKFRSWARSHSTNPFNSPNSDKLFNFTEFGSVVQGSARYSAGVLVFPA